MLQAIGGRMTEEAFELVLKNFDLDVRYPVSFKFILPSTKII